MKQLIPALCFSLLIMGHAAAEESQYAATRYPIVFAHGVFGFDRLGPVGYWYGIPEDLRKHGATVFVTQVSPFNSSEVRGEQLLQQVEDILAVTGAEKVNLIGHSHGAHSVRYVAGVAPEWVASASTTGGANFGSEVVDLVYGIQQSRWVGPLFTPFMKTLTRAYTRLLDILHGTALPDDPVATLYDLTTEGSAVFNARYPEGVPDSPCEEGDPVGRNGVYYYSWSGTKPFTSYFDPVDYAFALTATVFDSPSDALVERCASHLGHVIRDDYPINHLDEVNHLFGLTGSTDVKGIYRQHANRLKLQGL